MIHLEGMPKRHRPGSSSTSALAHVEEVVLATSGEDAFELVFAVAAARLLREPNPDLGITLDLAKVDPKLVARVDALLADALERIDALDAVFEALVSRVAKGQKGQFFTPRHVVDYVIRTLAPSGRDVVIDPACGSGAFLAHARARAPRGSRITTIGCDVDARAVRVARLLALAGGADSRTLFRDDGLRTSLLEPGTADVVATNPPFAGRADATGFEVARLVRAPERDVLFLERALSLLRPGGRLGIVLPYNKAAGAAFTRLRGWLFDHARVTRVVGLPRETFMPHTSQRCFLLFAEKTEATPRDKIVFASSEIAGKDVAGNPTGERPDLDAPAKQVVRRLADLGDDLALAPERHLIDAGDGIPLRDLVVERTERYDALDPLVVLDTTHAKDGVIDVPSARRADAPKSGKKIARRGDVIVSRLRPYLRQIALVPEDVAVSTEFYVLSPKSAGDDLAYLVPFLLSPRVQATLAAAQEGGHHPRVPRASLFALRVPHAVVDARATKSRVFRRALTALYAADVEYRKTLES